MKTAVIYARYSSNNQTEQSIEGQVRDCNEYAARNDILVVGTYIDRAMTGTNDNREQFQKMLKDSDKKAWNYVLVLNKCGGKSRPCGGAARTPSRFALGHRRQAHASKDKQGY